MTENEFTKKISKTMGEEFDIPAQPIRLTLRLPIDYAAREAAEYVFGESGEGFIQTIVASMGGTSEVINDCVSTSGIDMMSELRMVIPADAENFDTLFDAFKAYRARYETHLGEFPEAANTPDYIREYPALEV